MTEKLGAKEQIPRIKKKKTCLRYFIKFILVCYKVDKFASLSNNIFVHAFRLCLCLSLCKNEQTKFVNKPISIRIHFVQRAFLCIYFLSSLLLFFFFLSLFVGITTMIACKMNSMENSSCELKAMKKEEKNSCSNIDAGAHRENSFLILLPLFCLACHELRQIDDWNSISNFNHRFQWTINKKSVEKFISIVLENVFKSIWLNSIAHLCSKIFNIAFEKSDSIKKWTRS